MIANQTQPCPKCAKTVVVRGGISTLLVCIHCGSIIQNETGVALTAKPVPDDGSIIQIGSTGVFKEKGFEVIGRIHLQLHRDYRNFWCLWLSQDRTYAWLMETFGVFAYCKDSLFDLKGTTQLKVNTSVNLGAKSTVIIGSTDQCDAVSYEGETSGWKDFTPDFKVAQGNTGANVTAFFLRSPRKDRIRFVVGELTDFESLRLQNTRAWTNASGAKPFASVQCPQCNTSHIPRGRDLTIAMTCTKCGSYFGTRSWANELTTFKAVGVPAIPIGAKGKINDVTYELMGFVVKYVHRHNYKYNEYFLYNPWKGVAYLSEYDGHWNFLTPTNSAPKSAESIKTKITFEGSEYRIYQKFRAGIVFAKGEFFADVFSITADVACEEYISPPFLLSLESDHNSHRWHKGEYKSSSEIASAFNVSNSSLPKKKGIGYTQPFVASFDQMALIRICIGLVLIVAALQALFEINDQEKVVYQNTYDIADLKGDQKMFVTSSFDLEGDSRSLIIDFYAPVKNDWFYGDFTLISETDQSEYNFSHEIEYYAGTQDGESWSEGSQRGEAFLSKIPGGRYHINIYPQFSLTTFEFSISVTRDVSPLSNMWVTLALLGIFPFYYFIRKYYVERTRWSESDFSPYDNE